MEHSYKLYVEYCFFLVTIEFSPVGKGLIFVHMHRFPAQAASMLPLWNSQVWIGETSMESIIVMLMTI